SKDPNARPQTAKELLDALRACPLEHPWDQDRARSWWDTHHPTEWVDHSVVEGTFEESSVGSTVPGGLGWRPYAVGVVGLVVAVLAAVVALRPGSDEAPVTVDEPLGTVDEAFGTVDEEPGTVDEPLGIVEPPSPAAVEAVLSAPEPCRLWADGPPGLWSDVRDETDDEMSWLSGREEPMNADVVLRYSAEKAASGSETWRSCRSVTLISGGDTIEACSECATREYTFATLASVERWHAAFASSLGEQCTRQTLEALAERCGALGGEGH
ncbi:MAG: hypothetical protein JRI25_23615, partial [Deltaproteobacteria bacterium]|nr:hypothetical protein [Deltaproteobacteria bacterium]